MIRRVTVLGAGTMGHGIAHAAIAAGYDTRLFDVSPAALEKARASIEAIVISMTTREPAFITSRTTGTRRWAS